MAKDAPKDVYVPRPKHLSDYVETTERQEIHGGSICFMQ